MPTPSLGQLLRSTWKDFITHWVAFIALPTLWILGICGLVYEATVRINQHYKSYEDIAVVGAALLLIAAIVIVWSFSWVYYGAAVAHWANELKEGKQKLKLTVGLKSALKGLPGNLWTGILKQASIGLWSMLMVFPGVYKSITYCKALSISQLEGLHGLKALKKSAEWVETKGVGTVGVNKYASIFIGGTICGFIMFFCSFFFFLLFPTPPNTTADPRATGLGFLVAALLINAMISFLILQNTKEYLSAKV